MARLSWAVRLERAEKRGKFTEQEVSYAGSWLSCAVGERHGYPRKPGYQYITEFRDSPEYRLGLEFDTAVYDQDIPEAKRIYQLIQELP